MVRPVSMSQIHLPDCPEAEDLLDDIHSLLVLPDWDPEPYDKETEDDG